MWFLQPGITLTHVLIRILAILIIVFLIFPFHECAHAFIAHKLGDNTAKSMGRLTLNPLAHFDTFGASCLLLFDFGWAKPVPINPSNFKSPRRDMALTSLAGPLSNIVAAIIGGFIINLISIFSVQNELLQMFFSYYISINTGLAVFNLIPLPGFDGYKILEAFIPQKFLVKYYQNQSKIGCIIFLLIFLGFFNGPFNFLQRVICNSIINITYFPFMLFK